MTTRRRPTTARVRATALTAALILGGLAGAAPEAWAQTVRLGGPMTPAPAPGTAESACPGVARVIWKGSAGFVDEPLDGVVAPPVAPELSGGHVFVIYMKGICETWANSSSSADAHPFNKVHVCVDQRGTMDVAVADFARVLDHFCPGTGDNFCRIYTYSNGGAVTSRALAAPLAQERWNVDLVLASASNEGGTPASDSWTFLLLRALRQTFGPVGALADVPKCGLAVNVSPSDHRPAWDHDATGGALVYLGPAKRNPGFRGWLLNRFGIFHGPHDQVVDFCSSGAYATHQNTDHSGNSSRIIKTDLCEVVKPPRTIYPDLVVKRWIPDCSCWCAEEENGSCVRQECDPDPCPVYDAGDFRWANHLLPAGSSCNGHHRVHTSAFSILFNWDDTVLCGNDVADPGETWETCPEDLPYLAYCGDRDPDTEASTSNPACDAASGETPESCTGDCGPRCGNHRCEPDFGETRAGCADDCMATCDDGFCAGYGAREPATSPNPNADGETYLNCPGDCPAPVKEDGVCEFFGDQPNDEDCNTDYYDCGVCPAEAGNAICEIGETSAAAPYDCPPLPCQGVVYGDVRITAGSGIATCTGTDLAIRKGNPGQVTFAHETLRYAAP